MLMNGPWAHGDVDHSKTNLPTMTLQSAVPPLKNVNEIYSKINASFLKKVRPIFKKSCFDCHSNQTTFPWYYNVPGIKQLIDSDIKEAKTHLDFSKGFPFTSHVSPIKDLKGILRSLSEEEMPPQRYLWFHGEKKLTNNESKKIKNWIIKSLEALE